MHVTKVLTVGIAAAVTAALGLASPVAAAPAEAALAAVTGETVPGSYIVVFKDGTGSVATLAAAVTSQHSAGVRRTYAAALRGAAITATEQQARRIAADSRVAYVQPNTVFRASATQSPTPSYGLDRIDQRALPLTNSYTYSTTASNVHAYIIDTGIRFSHADLGGRATSGFDAIDGGSADDCNGHGTHVAGTVGGSAHGVAKGVQLVGVRVLDCEGSGTTEQVVAGIDWVTANAVKPAVANMSLGGGADAVLDAAVRASIASGVTYGIAAGNGFLGLFALDACTQSPARVAEAITVSVTNNTDTKASWGNRGTCVDVFAPGINIVSSWNTSDTATNTISGTSMSTPHVVGAAALYLANNTGASPAAVQAAIISNATTGVVKSPGSGSPNRLLYTGNF
ncbi:subtilisin family serine protease [Allocatelliglobosispora scoriae]|uniref:Subtilisin family serine protease n=1 Tax=Allocatelliglobosispora scoriae TaxID=643052 RepID=A0A841C2D8_9ACTN|nr:S8 family peptidase [Allocatelliglobosispora scoriae]MBB5873303.1 subtilisin family serine protease [Allocatelliglobosispora scoriae]